MAKRNTEAPAAPFEPWMHLTAGANGPPVTHGFPVELRLAGVGPIRGIFRTVGVKVHGVYVPSETYGPSENVHGLADCVVIPDAGTLSRIVGPQLEFPKRVPLGRARTRSGRYEWDRSGKGALEAAQIPAGRNPLVFPFGILSGGTGMDGSSMLLWFKDPREMLAYLESAPRVLDFVTAVDWAPIRRATQTIVARAEDLGELNPDVMLELDAAQRDVHEIRWWGTFEDLCHEPDERAHAAGLRRAFRERRSSRPVLEKERRAFAEWLREHNGVW